MEILLDVDHRLEVTLTPVPMVLCLVMHSQSVMLLTLMGLSLFSSETHTVMESTMDHGLMRIEVDGLRRERPGSREFNRSMEDRPMRLVMMMDYSGFHLTISAQSTVTLISVTYGTLMVTSRSKVLKETPPIIQGIKSM